MADYAKPGYGLRNSIAWDQAGQAAMGRGRLGITISARSGTADYDYEHGAQEKHHLWGVWLAWLLDRCWPFGCDPVTGERHVVGAIKGDRWRAYWVLVDLWKYYPEPELVVALQALIDDKQAKVTTD